jgi:hypothetical protein
MIDVAFRPKDRLRIAFLGNMNNNHFAMARYLRDEGFACELLLFVDEQEHFHPRCDTYDLNYRAWVKQLRWGSERQLLTIRPSVIADDIAQYDVIIGCGLAPAFLYKAGRPLDIMIPYGDDIWTATQYRLVAPHYLPRSLSAAYFQRKGLAQVKITNTTLLHGVYAGRISELSPKSTIWEFGVPMVYERQYRDTKIIDRTHWGAEFARLRQENQFMVVAHGRHVWGQRSNPNVKGNDVLLEGWSIFCKNDPGRKKVLVLFEYGEHVPESKDFIRKLGIESTCCWLPRMYRKDLMPGLMMSDLVCGEFVHSWDDGGVIYEALVAGKPLLMFRDEDHSRRRAETLYSIYNARSPEQVAERLHEYVSAPDSGKQLGQEGKRWYEENVVKLALAKYTDYFEHCAKSLGKAARC